MKCIVTREEAIELKNSIHKVLFANVEEGKKVMCVLFPSNGLYVAEGIARYVCEKETQFVDVTEYFRGMSLGDYYDFKATLNLEKNANNMKGGKNEYFI